MRKRIRLLYHAAQTALGADSVSDAELMKALNAPSADGLTHMLRAKELRFFFLAQEKDNLAEQFVTAYAETAKVVIAKADAACRHEFDILGSGPVAMKDGVRWHEDFASGRRWRRGYSALLPVQYDSDESDIKRVWELSRCQHFAVLGEAYALTGDEKFARAWVAQMMDWDRQNPPLIGPNWMSPMEVAIRIVNWIWGFAFMGDSPAFTDEARKVFYRNLLSHGRFILRHQEGYGNHRFSNFVGLVFLGVLFPEFKEAGDWREAGIKGFCEELERQVRSDGVHFEGSIPYHRLVLEMAATTWRLLRRNGMELPPASQDAIKRMFHFTAAYLPAPGLRQASLQPDGFAPQIGDADDGRLQELTPLDKRDHSYLLSLAAVLTGRSEYKITEKPHPEAFWLLGEDGRKVYGTLTERSHRDHRGQQETISNSASKGDSLCPLSPLWQKSVAFPESGFYVLRSERLHALISCRRPDARDVGAHSHNDHLSFTLSADGLDFIVDAGSFTYTGNMRERNRFRGTLSHNTIMVDDAEINPLKAGDPFRLRDTARCAVVQWLTEANREVLAVEHEGYGRLGVSVRREFILDRSTPFLTLKDRVTGKGRHRLAWRFHFAPEVKVELEGRELRAQRQGRVLRMLLPLIPDTGTAPHSSLHASWYSPSYGVRQISSVLVLSAIGELPIAAEFVLTLQDMPAVMNGQLLETAP